MNLARRPPQPQARQRVLQALQEWVARGWLRRLDRALALLIDELVAAGDPQVLLASALLAHLEGLGHACLRLDDEHELVGLGVQAELAEALRGLALALLPAGARSFAQAWQGALQDSPAVWFVDRDAGDDPGRPLVLEAGRLYLRRYRDFEQRLAAQWLARARDEPEQPDGEVAAWMDRLFDPPADAGADWQRIACAIALRSRVCVITGGPGTGKTHTAARLLVLLLATAAQPRQLRIALAAPTGKAAARLKESIDTALLQLAGRVGEDAPALRLAAAIEPARTLHALLGARSGDRGLRHHPGHPLPADVVLVDEASMVHLEMMARLLEALPEGARLVLLGDRDQLASVEAGAVLADLCRHAAQGHYRPGTASQVQRLSGQAIEPALQDAQGPLLAQSVVMLRRSHRFGSSIAALADAVQRGDAAQARAALAGHAELRWLEQATATRVGELALADGGLRECLELARAGCAGDDSQRDSWALRVLRGLESFRVLCAVRGGPLGVEAMNRELERALRSRDLLGSGSPWFAGRVVMVTRNDPDLGLFNGDVGVALRGPADALRVAFAQGGRVRWVAAARLDHVETAFAITVHKSQGSEFGHAVVVLGDGHGVTRELLYTAVTRARSRLSLCTAQPQVLEQGLARLTRRGSGLWRRLRAGEALADGGSAKDPTGNIGSNTNQ